MVTSLGHLNLTRLEQRAKIQHLGSGHAVYAMRLGSTQQAIQDALRLRYQVSNLELKEGLESAFVSGYDTDEFDSVCDHLIVEHVATKCVVGTYRLQTGNDRWTEPGLLPRA